MPTNIYEKHLSRGFTIDAKTASIPVEYVVTGTMDEGEVYELVALTAPVTVYHLVRKNIKADPQGGGIWFVSVEYATIDAQQAVGVEPAEPVAPAAGDKLGPAFSFDTTGSTVHITQSILTRSKTRAGGGAAPDNKQAIGVSKDRVEGCDIFAAQFQWGLDVQRANCTGQYLLTLFACTGKVNYNNRFYGFEAGEVLYLGASGRFTFNERWSITHKFACQPNQINLDVGNGITVPVKKGWDYLWIGYKDEVTNGVLMQVPDTAYVEVVYGTANFATLEVGG